MRRTTRSPRRRGVGKGWVVAIVVVALLGAGVFVAYPQIYRTFFAPTESNLPNGASATTPAPSGDAPSDDVPDVETAQQGLTIPWELAFLPDGRTLITERPGQLLLIGTDRSRITVSGVQHEGEGGLLGMSLHPDFAKNQQLYLYLTTVEGGALRNRIERYRLDGTTLVDRTMILQDIPGAAVHDGGRMRFGPDGKLYVGTGDAATPDSAQDTTSLAGKILRLNPDGSTPGGNPFGNAVWSYGHRNVQGLAWDSQGRMWATEHGPSGAPPESGQDELNLIEPGANYGWPVITGDETAADMRSPIVHSGIDETWAPSGVAFYDGSIFFAGLRGESLYEARIVEQPGAQPTVELKAHFRGEFGRLRSVLVAGDSMFYLLTNNTDGRGTPHEGDDKLIRIHSRVFRR